MKIAIIYDAIYPYVIGGGEKRAYYLAKELSKEHEVHLFGMKFWKGDKVIKKEGIFYHGVCKPIPLYKKGRRNFLEPFSFSYGLLKNLFQEDFDIVDCYNFPYFPCFIAKFYCLVKKKPLVITWLEHWGDYWYDYLGFKGSIGKFIERLTLKLSDNVVVISKDVKEKLMKNGISVKATISLGVNLETINGIKVKKRNIDILYAGRLMKEKKIDFLIRAIKELDNVNCLIIGEGPEKKFLQDLVKELDLKNRVKFLDFIEENKLYRYMKSAKIFALPSIREGFSLVTLEASACGCHVINIGNRLNNVEHCKLTVSDIHGKISSLLKKKNNKESIKNDWKKVSKLLEDFYYKVNL